MTRPPALASAQAENALSKSAGPRTSIGCNSTCNASAVTGSNELAL
jgi:hypothetical protein